VLKSGLRYDKDLGLGDLQLEFGIGVRVIRIRGRWGFRVALRLEPGTNVGESFPGGANVLHSADTVERHRSVAS